MALEAQVSVRDANGVTKDVPTFLQVQNALTGGVVNEAEALTIAAGGTAQELFPANSDRKTFGFSNNTLGQLSEDDLGADIYLRFGAEAGERVGLLIPPAGSVLLSEGSTPLDEISIWCSRIGATFYAFEI